MFPFYLFMRYRNNLSCNEKNISKFKINRYIYNTILRMVLFALKTSFPNKNALKLFLSLVGFCVINSKRIFSSDMICFSLIKNSKKWNQYSMSTIIPNTFFYFIDTLSSVKCVEFSYKHCSRNSNSREVLSVIIPNKQYTTMLYCIDVSGT